MVIPQVYQENEITPVFCLKSGKFDNTFPKIEGKHKHDIPNNPLIEISLYCVCRIPYFESDDEVQELQMAEYVPQKLYFSTRLCLQAEKQILVLFKVLMY